MTVRVDQALDVYDERVREILVQLSSGDPIRNNGLSSYLRHTVEMFAAIKSGNQTRMPTSVQLEITNECTTSCRMCERYRWTRSASYDHTKELAFQRWEELFREFATLGIHSLTWGGGEPTAHPRFSELLQRAHELGLGVGVLTNGVGITPSIAERLVASAAWVRISLDDPPHSSTTVRKLLPSSDAVQHPANAVMASLENIRRAERTQNRTVQKSINFTIQRRNFEQIAAMIDCVSEVGIPLTLKFAHGDTKRFLCSEEQIHWIRETVLRDPRIANNPLVNVAYLRDMVLTRLPIADIARGTPTAAYYAKNATTCFTSHLFSFIDAFGGVHTCCHWYDANGAFESEQRDAWKIGDISDASFAAVWASSAYRETRRSISPIDPSKTPCSNCTRYWVTNTALSRLYEEVFVPLTEVLGLDGALRAYGALAEVYGESESTWT